MIGRLFSLCALLSLGACAVEFAALEIGPHLVGGIPADVPGHRPRLGVGPFVDQRPAPSRRAARPQLRLRWWGLVRQGESQTGDDAFRGEIAEGVRRDTLATLARSGAYGQLRLVESLEESPELDLFLDAVVEELVGVQSVYWALDLTRAGWIRRRSEDPVGIARVHFRLFDRHGLLWEDRIETWRAVPGARLARAALDAMAITNERLAHQLYRLLIRDPEADLRELPVRVLDGCGLGRKAVLRLISDASEILEREAGVRLVPVVQTWNAPRTAPGADSLLGMVRRISAPTGGILIALLRFPFGTAQLFEREHGGLAGQLGRHAAIACQGDQPVAASTIVHEVGHLFGAVHVDDRTSLMHPIAEFDPRFFDPLNRRILQLTRERSFDSPLPPDLAQAVQGIIDGAAR